MHGAYSRNLSQIFGLKTAAKASFYESSLTGHFEGSMTENSHCD